MLQRNTVLSWGSQNLFLQNIRDYDFIIITPNIPFHIMCHYWVQNLNIHLCALETLQYFCSFSNFQKEYVWNLAMLWLDKSLIGPNCLNFDITSHWKQLQQTLDYIKINKLYNYNPLLTNQWGTMLKTTYYYVFGRFVLQNHSTKLTPQQFDTLQKIHDRKMTWTEYLNMWGY